MINRANPGAAIVSHCQPTVSVTGASTDGVAQETTTSRPCVLGPSSATGADVHVQVRPAESVTVLSDMTTFVVARTFRMVRTERYTAGAAAVGSVSRSWCAPSQYGVSPARDDFSVLGW